MEFSELKLMDEVYQGIQDAGFTTCTEVQEQTLKHTLQGRDVCVQSQTGTGKTAAYLVSVFQLMLTREDFKNRISVIIAPTRELAVQIEQEASLLARHAPLRIGCFYGGVGYAEQEKLIADGVDVVIGTPGRLIDFSQSGKLDFSRVGMVIIDEADRLFDMGFYPDIRRMLRRMPPREKRTSMLFSATLSVRARNIAWEHMNDPMEVEINPEQVTVEGISQLVYHVGRKEKLKLLLGLLQKENPETAVIFTNTKRAAEEVSRRLEMNGYPSTFIMGDLPQRKRLRVIERIKEGKVRILVATDVAARGLHINDLDMVINYDLPEDRESYVHRIGRTARAGKTGKAVSLADEQNVFNLEGIESFIGMKIPAEYASDDMLAEDSSAGIRIALGNYGDGNGRDRGRTRGSAPSRDFSRGRNDGRDRNRARDQSRGGDRDRVKSPPPAREHESAAPVAPRGRTGRSNNRGSGRTQPRPAAAVQKGNAGRSGPAGEPRPGKAAPMDERLDYYRKKYGEEFSHGGTRSSGGGKPSSGKNGHGAPRKGRDSAQKKVPGASPQAAEQKTAGKSPREGSRGVWSRIAGLFRRADESNEK
jgi:ATP-dependent RNA helicase RhlB